MREFVKAIDAYVNPEVTSYPNISKGVHSQQLLIEVVPKKQIDDTNQTLPTDPTI